MVFVIHSYSTVGQAAHCGSGNGRCLERTCWMSPDDFIYAAPSTSARTTLTKEEEGGLYLRQSLVQDRQMNSLL